MNELQPCPFCGRTDCDPCGPSVSLTNDAVFFYVRCGNCGACGPRMENERPARACWNRSAELSAAQPYRPELVEAIKRDILNIGSIYRTVGDALYDEPVQRLAERIANTVLGEDKAV